MRLLRSIGAFHRPPPLLWSMPTLMSSDFIIFLIAMSPLYWLWKIRETEGSTQPPRARNHSNATLGAVAYSGLSSRRFPYSSVEISHPSPITTISTSTTGATSCSPFLSTKLPSLRHLSVSARTRITKRLKRGRTKNQVHGLFLFKHENAFYHVREGSLFGDLKSLQNKALLICLIAHSIAPAPIQSLRWSNLCGCRVRRRQCSLELGMVRLCEIKRRFLQC